MKVNFCNENTCMYMQKKIHKFLAKFKKKLPSIFLTIFPKYISYSEMVKDIKY